MKASTAINPLAKIFGIVIDNCGFQLQEDDEGIIRAIQQSGGAGAVAMGHVNAALEAGGSVIFFATPKNAIERELAKKNESFQFSYNNKEIHLRFVDIDFNVYQTARNDFFSNGLWMRLTSMLDGRYSLPRTPFQWASFEKYNRAMAEQVARHCPQKAFLVVHDSHFALLGTLLRESQRNDLTTAFFCHTAFFQPTYLEQIFKIIGQANGYPTVTSGDVIPDDPQPIISETTNSEGKTFPTPPLNLVWNEVHMAYAYLAALASGFHSVVFHTQQWEKNFLDCLDFFEIQAPHTGSAMASVDHSYIHALMNPAPGSRDFDKLSELAGKIEAQSRGRTIVGVGGRFDPYKNIPLVVEAFTQLCEEDKLNPEQIALAVMSTKTREGLSSYDTYADDVNAAIKKANQRLGVNDAVISAGGPYLQVLTWMKKLSVMVTAAHYDGLVLMPFEVHEVNRHCYHVVSTLAGIHNYMAPLEAQGLMTSITPTGILTDFDENTQRFLPDADDLANMKEALLQAYVRSQHPDFDRKLRSGWQSNHDLHLGEGDLTLDPAAHLQEIIRLAMSGRSVQDPSFSPRSSTLQSGPPKGAKPLAGRYHLEHSASRLQTITTDGGRPPTAARR